VLRAIGWLGSIILFPLAFLRREDIEQNIKKIFQEEDFLMKIGRMFGFIIDVMVKSIGETLHALINIPLYATKLVRKIDQWFFGGTGEKGEFELFLEGFLEEFRKNIEDFNFVDLVAPISDFLAELIAPIILLFTDTDAFVNTYITPIKEWGMNKLAGIGDSLKQMLLDIVEWLKGLFTWDNLKSILLNGTGLGAIIQGGKWVKDKFSSSDKKTTEPPYGPLGVGKVGDLIDDNERVLYSKGEAYQFDKNDQIMALKKGGPIQEALNSMDSNTKTSVDQLKSVVEQIGKNFADHFKKAESLYDAEYKLLNENNDLLKQIKDKESSSSNVVVNNSSSNMVFSQKTSSNNEYRADLANKVFAY
jgi:hypothetical protein